MVVIKGVLLPIGLAAVLVALATSHADGQGRPLPSVQPLTAPWEAASSLSVMDEPPYATEKTFATPEVWYEQPGDVWCWQVLPDGIIFKSYLAGVKESRLSTYLTDLRHDGWMFDGTMGGRFGLFRYGNYADVLPQGWQFDIEASAQVRLDIPEEVDVRSTDYRAGAQLTYGIGRQQWRFGYYHLSSHLGDEFLLKNGGFNRLNYARDVIILGYGFNVTPNLRLYAEAGWAFWQDVAEPWEFQFGIDYAPAYPTGFRGAPFVALNGHLREECDFGGHFVFQTGWAWRSDENGHLFRVGLNYFNGQSFQYSVFYNHEEQIGLGIWYDF